MTQDAITERTDTALRDIIARQTEQLADMQEQMQALKTASERKLTLKVTAPKADPKTGQMKGSSGAVSLYGLGQFPVTLYASQWERLLDSADTIRAFIATNAALVARK